MKASLHVEETKPQKNGRMHFRVNENDYKH